MEIYLELIEFVKAHRLIGSSLSDTLTEVDKEFDNLEGNNIYIEGIGHLIDIVYKESENRLVMVTSIFMTKENN